MFFCPNCNNSYDITKTIPEKFSQQFGGGLFSDSTSESITSEIETESSAPPESSGGAISLIDRIVNGEDLVEKDVANINVENFIKGPEYKKLNSKNKELVFNKIQDLLTVDKKKIKSQIKPGKDDVQPTFFICNNCGYSEKIRPGTQIFSRTSENISRTYAVSDYSDMLHSDILPRTRKYICPNKKCISHKDLSKREAVFFRLNNSFRLKYICTACKEQF